MRLEELVLISHLSLVQEEEGSNERLHQPKQEVEVLQQDQDVKEEQGNLRIVEAVEDVEELLLIPIGLFYAFLTSSSTIWLLLLAPGKVSQLSLSFR